MEVVGSGVGSDKAGVRQGVRGRRGHGVANRRRGMSFSLSLLLSLSSIPLHLCPICYHLAAAPLPFPRGASRLP